MEENNEELDVFDPIFKIKVGSTINVYEWRVPKTIQATVTRKPYWVEELNQYYVLIDFQSISKKSILTKSSS